jgi:type I restriction-modification system DNA methylase subunit
MEDRKKEFLKEVEAASRHRFAVEVFADMVRAMAIAIESPLTFGERRAHLEAEYEQIRGRYDADEFAHFPRAFAIVAEALEEKREDFLGHALEHLGASNTRNGQFLTPVCVSRMMAATLLHDKLYDYVPGKIVKINDCACGSSVLMIEAAEQLHRCGVRGDDILVIAGDIDSRACDISYVQLSLLGYAAIVQHADALMGKRISPDRFTPGYFMACMPMRGAA